MSTMTQPKSSLPRGITLTSSHYSDSHPFKNALGLMTLAMPTHHTILIPGVYQVRVIARKKFAAQYVGITII